MKKLLFLLPLAVAFLLPHTEAHAQQQYVVVASCGGQSLPPGGRGTGYMDVTGNICSSAVGGSSTFVWPGTSGNSTYGAIGITGTVPAVNAGTTASVGAYVDGSNVTIGTTTQAPCATPTTTPCSLIQVARLQAQGGGAGGGTSSNFGAVFPSTGTASGAEYLSAAPTLTSGQMVALQTDVNGNLNVNVKAGGGTGGGTSSNFSATFPTAGTAAGAEYLSAPPTLTTGQMVPFQTDVNGNLNVNVKAGGGSGGTSSSFNTTFPSTGTASGAEYLSSPPTLTTGQMVALQTDINGNLNVNVKAGGGSGGGAVTASAGAYANGWSPDIGNATTAAPWSGTGTPSVVSLLWGIYNTASSSYNYQQAPIPTTITSAGSYAAGNAVGGLKTVSIMRTTTQPTLLLTQLSLTLTNVPVAGPPTFIVFIWNKNPVNSTCTDHTAFSLDVATGPDSSYIVSNSPFSITPTVPTAGTTAAFGAAPAGVMPISVQNVDTTVGQNIYICLVASAAFTNPASTVGPIINIGAIRD